MYGKKNYSPPISEVDEAEDWADERVWYDWVDGRLRLGWASGGVGLELGLGLASGGAKLGWDD